MTIVIHLHVSFKMHLIAGNTQFLNNEILSRLQSGAISLVGKFGEVDPPHIASPITVEPTKPRMCINLMYLSCFVKDTPNPNPRDISRRSKNSRW